MPDHPRTIGTDMDLGTQPDTLHVESALRLDRQNPSARFIVPGQGGTFAFPPQQPPYPSETARLGLCPNCHVLFDVGTYVLSDDLTIVDTIKDRREAEGGDALLGDMFKATCNPRALPGVLLTEARAHRPERGERHEGNGEAGVCV
ncbi:hypothetical protein AB0I51_40940 [Streptomyces sp. NPDC050549]|uniref:hypothetical protein n=1 Tax=Streptomyces sp. NPDC050549 TaxID=3155406 RepID=UPI0034482EAD